MNKLLSVANKVLFMGNEAIARGALEAGVNVAAAYRARLRRKLSKISLAWPDQRNLFAWSGPPAKKWQWKWPPPLPLPACVQCA